MREAVACGMNEQRTKNGVETINVPVNGARRFTQNDISGMRRKKKPCREKN